MGRIVTFDEVVSAEDVPVVVANQRGLIDRVNQAFIDAFGWSQSEVAEQPLTMLIPSQFHDAHNLGFSRFLATERATLLGQALELTIVCADGRELAAEHFIVAKKIDDDWCFAAVIRAP